MQMTTRRAVRPDSKHHRDSRRQKLTRSARPGRRFSPMFWMNTLLASLCALSACGVIRLVLGPQGPWLWWATGLSGAALLISVVGIRSALRS